MQICLKIKELRKDAGLTQFQVSDKIGVTPSQLNAIENGASFFVTEALLDRVAKCFDVNADELIAEAGIVPNDVKAVIFKNPKSMCRLIRYIGCLGWLDDDKLEELAEEIGNREFT